MDERKILARFEKRNIFDPNDPKSDIVSQQNEIITAKYGRLAFLALRNGRKRLLRFFPDCH
jgi:hypothetical protein